MGIASNNTYYNHRCLTAKSLVKEELWEDALRYIELTAHFAWHNYSGYYTSEVLEGLLEKIGQQLFCDVSPIKAGNNTRLLHVCSELYDEGGHSKLLLNWIKNNPNYQHTILSTRTSLEELNRITKDFLGDTPVELISLASPHKLDVAKGFYEILKNGYTALLLHIHPDEAVVPMVLSLPQIEIPVAFINHADHVFWLGASVTDILVQIREANIPLDEKRRGIPAERQMVLPIPIPEQPKTIRRTDESTINLLSTGTEYKYTPNKAYNFMKEALRVVKEHENVTFHIVGVSANAAMAQPYLHDRIIYHGIIPLEQLKLLEEQTDIYVEGFPMASFTALLQVALRGIPFQLQYQPLPVFRLFAEYPNAPQYPKNLEDWHESLHQLISNADYRRTLATEQHLYIQNIYSLEAWKIALEKLYKKLFITTHKVHPIKNVPYCDGPNEKILIETNGTTINHYMHTSALSRKERWSVYRNSYFRNRNVNYRLSTNSKFSYLLGLKTTL